MREIKKIAVIGASGNMGSSSGGIFAQANIQCVYFARDVAKAESGMNNAVGQARSEVLKSYIVAKSYDDLEKELPSCDWIFEGLAEDMVIKREFFAKIDKFRKPDSIVSTVSSGLSIEEMAASQSESFQSHFLGTHFYNPPSKLPANELIFHSKMPLELRNFITDFCEKVLRRQNIVTHNTPAFAGNRIGFQFLNYAAQQAEIIGVEKIDYLLGPYTGRAMAPLATIDLVGLDVHKAIVDNVYAKVTDEVHATYKMPAYMQKMIDSNILGLKTKGGFFKRGADKEKLVLNTSNMTYQPVAPQKIDFVEKIKQSLHDGMYEQAIHILKNAEGSDADIVKKFILGYISYSFNRIGEATPIEDGIHGIDKVMAFGFSWLPPSGWVDLLGGSKEVIQMMEKYKIAIPSSLQKISTNDKICKIADITKFLIAR